MKAELITFFLTQIISQFNTPFINTASYLQGCKKKCEMNIYACFFLYSIKFKREKEQNWATSIN